MNTATTDSTSQPTRCVVDTKPPARRAGIALVGSMLVALGTGCQTAPAATPHADLGSTPITDNGSKENERPTMKITESGSGRNVLILHGGGGPATMTLLGAHLAEKAHVITPTYPGWDGTPRPESLTTVGALAEEIVHYLDEHDVKDVLVIGSSIGGWIAPEVALRDRAHRVSGLVIINGTGVNVPGQPITNVTGFTPPQLAKVAFHDPSKFGAGAPPPTPERLAMMRANAATLAMFSGSGDTYSCDPGLLVRLKGIHVPTLVLWGESDHVVTKEYGRAYAAAIPNARFETVADAGHLPWLEQPEATFRVLDPFVAATAASGQR
jgi:pimeloyl-ACP methyl ester carboxylesterase